MRRADQVGGLLLLVFAVWFSAGALEFPYWAPTGPGSGFLPFWLGVALGILALMLVVQASRAGTPGAAWLPGGPGLRRLLVVVGATVVLVTLLPVLGMTLGAALFLVGILRFLEAYSWFATVAIAIGTAVTNYLVFTYWLRVPFPVGVLGF
ncbi:MAG TPA: tripartite tricarboxylate transporter TctB family protein [Methylomirabilota bacterium]|nr:tripartite tricarboxylate transporter TctB family protein [Methylomirabilota bacterium]